MASGEAVMKIGVVGLWHLGAVTAACLAAAGYSVIGFDHNPETISGLKKGQLPVFEPRLKELIQRGMEANRLCFSSNPQDLNGVEIIWIAYDTPVDEMDRADVEFVVERATAIFPFVGLGSLILISSQLPAGSTRRLEEIYRRVRPEGTGTFAHSPRTCVWETPSKHLIDPIGLLWVCARQRIKIGSCSSLSHLQSRLNGCQLNRQR